MKKYINNSRPATPLLYFLVGVFLSIGLAAGYKSLAATGTISGVVFKDINRNQIMDPGEEPMVGRVVYIFDFNQKIQMHATTDSTGRYEIMAVPSGDYEVHYSSSQWWEIWNEWAPTTNNSWVPQVKNIKIDDAVPVTNINFGWRPIIKSTDENSPISSMTTPNGLKIKVYNDVVPAGAIYDSLMQGTLNGAEAPLTTVRLGLIDTNICRASYSGLARYSDGSVVPGSKYSDFRAIIDLNYLSWLGEGDTSLFHEYGHSWSIYHSAIVQQDPDLTEYLKVRNLYGDSRVGTEYLWSRLELVAEDYRQLFGSPNAALRPHIQEGVLPHPSEVTDLREYLSGPFMNQAITLDTYPPSAPSGLTANATSTTQINLTWNASTDNVGVVGYNIYRNNTLITSVTDTSYSDMSVVPSTSYQYFIRAKDAAGNTSGPSSTAGIATPSTVTGITGTVSNSTGLMLTNAKVTIGKGSSARTAYTNSSGHYTLGGLAPGTYNVSYSLKGYATTSAAVTITTGIVTKNITLQKR